MLTRKEYKKLNRMAEGIYGDWCLMNLKRYGNQEAAKYMKERVSKKAEKYRKKRLSEHARSHIYVAEEQMLSRIPSYVKETRERLGYSEPRKPRKFTKRKRFLNKYGKIAIPAAAAASVPPVLLAYYKLTGDLAPLGKITSLMTKAGESVPRIKAITPDPFSYVSLEKIVLIESGLFATMGAAAGVALDTLSDLISGKRKKDQYGRLREELKKMLEV
ncbi:MAG: hypothetical protein GTN38_04215 [Candidatus Aenigmarchaeota archaeon]|nr:hypothetical protein [Candidatus Aenigmarchaeota archaeon]NIP40867.1 hypothetical protein [Candidatus Aenigmarchaeota archaeon]NIQ17981.1 hypothetical protein [Candidatus Aenigmarchaeota archaeon]NIS73570.1 hypothetical protein [Candidatus Aenigmarchaeota archaeon]